MKQALLLAILVCCVACSEGDHNMLTDMTLETSADSVEIDADIGFSITASTGGATITSCRIDFDDDGTWDDTQTHDGHAITATFHHAFATAGTKLVRAQVLSSDEVLATRTASVAITLKVVVLGMWATSTVPSAPCLAENPAGIWQRITSLESSRVVGGFPSGPALISQRFGQMPAYPTSGPSLPYSCHFFVRAYLRSSGVEFASSDCTTSSSNIACHVDLAAIVP